MRIPLSWLSDFVALPPVDDLVRGLNSLGLKVEGVHRPAGGVEGVVVGEVLDIEQHPNAEKLILVDVRLEDGERRIVCGARNFSVGDRVPVALPGAVLPGGRTIERAEIRGQASDGMLCSARELGVSDDHSGILVLPAGAPLSADVAGVLGLDEVVIDVEITPNRPDCMGLLGVAREVAAWTGSTLTLPETSFEESDARAADLASVRVDDPRGCPRYLAMVVTDLAAGPSPGWVQRRLAAAGLRPIGSVVDATNYALLVTGHPMHAFDLAKVGSRQIVVRRATPGETLVTIDGEERPLDPGDLVIADASRALALAGVMGGIESEVSGTTREILLESAHFDPRAIYRTSLRHGLRSEASSRFERGTDPNNVDFAARYACALMQQWAGGRVAGGAIDVYPQAVASVAVALRPERANALLGTDLSTEEMADIFRRLDLECDSSDGRIRVIVPSRRADLAIEEDLIEEVARVTGYDNIPARLPPGSNRRGALTREQKLLRRIRSILRGAGLSEAYTSSLISPEAPLAESPGLLRLANPMSQEESALRPSLLPGLLGSVARNVARRSLSVRLFEIGYCFGPSGQILPSEVQRLGIALHGPVAKEWHTSERDQDFFDLKGVVEVLLDRLRIEGASYEAAAAPGRHPVRAATLRLGGQSIGTLGELSSDIARRYDLSHRAYVAELDLAPLLEAAEPPPEVKETPRFPAVLLDLAVALPEETSAADVLQTARRAGGEALEDLRIFDLYRGEQVGEGRKSLALSLAFRRADRTLTEEEALAARDSIVKAIADEHGGEVRG